MTLRYHDLGPLRRLLRRSGAVRAVSWLYARVLPGFDRQVFRLTGGRVLPSAALTGLPVVMLTTTGARSGLPRTVPLVGLRRNEAFAVIASNFGSDRHPAWYRNLMADPEALVSVGGRAWKVRAHEVHGEERAALWETALDLYPAWRAYERTAGARTIPVMVLLPATGAPST